MGPDVWRWSADRISCNNTVEGMSLKVMGSGVCLKYFALEGFDVPSRCRTCFPQGSFTDCQQFSVVIPALSVAVMVYSYAMEV